jgi:NAD(P)-dependent dehydrogenase (short-subunit alcohol dehydrogenase family)
VAAPGGSVGAVECRLDGKVALVTGASRGIGRAIAAAYAEAGASVMLSSRKADALEEAVAGIRPAAGAELATFAANAGDPEAAAACVAATVERFGRVDVLVNNAATSPYMGPMIDIDLPRLDKTYDVNLRGAFVWTQEAWRRSMQTHGGVVVNISSIGGLSVETSIGHYNVTKAALIHLTKSLAADLAPGVRVVAICPGLVKTDMARALWESNEEAVGRMVPLQRLGEPEDIAEAAVFLASDAASWITGTTLVVDGGMLL